MFTTDLTRPLSPLADPVVSAIFTSVETAGLAAESLVRVVLESDNNLLTGKIVRVTPQSTHSSPYHRGCRVDMEIETDTNEWVLAEVQMITDAAIMQRGLFSSSSILTKTSTKGDTSAQMVAKLPRVICINILGYNIREDNIEVVQPFKILYTKPPHAVAIPNFSGYNVQLPRLLEMEPDFTSGLYCWGYTLYTAHKQGKSVQEVVSMTPALQAYAKRDDGYQQFCEQYQLAAADPDTRDAYVNWILSIMKEEGMREGARIEGLREGRLQGVKEGRLEGIKEGIKEQSIAIARNMLKRSRPIEEIIEDTGLTHDEIMSII